MTVNANETLHIKKICTLEKGFTATASLFLSADCKIKE